MFEVHTKIGDNWENTWSVEGIPMEFDTQAEAEAEIQEHISDTIASVKEGHLAYASSRDEFQIYRLTSEVRLKRALTLLLSTAELNQEGLELDTLNKIEYARSCLDG